MTEMIENPVVASSIQETEIPSSLHAEKDRETTLSRYEDVDKVDHYVRSIPDTLLMFSEDMGIWLVGYGMRILQIVSSIMVIITESNNYSANPSVANVMTSFATSVAVAARINSSSLELFINMDCLKLVRKERPKDKLLERKNGIITLYLFGQLLLILATSVSISQQPNPVGIITNGAGLLLLQRLDYEIFPCLKIPAKASHNMKEKLQEVMKNPRHSSQRVFYGSFILIYAGIILSMICLG